MKQILTFVLLMLSFIACHQPTTEHMQTTHIEPIIRQYFEHFNNHDWAQMAALYADTTEFKDPSLGPDIVQQTRAQIIAKYTELQEILPDVKDEIVQLYPSGDKHIIVEFISTGTAPDGSAVELPICTIFTIENGLITKDYTYYDNFEDPE